MNARIWAVWTPGHPPSHPSQHHMLRPYPLCCGACSGRTLCVLLRAIPSLFVDLFCGSPLPLFSFSCPSLWTHFGHTLGGLLALLLTLGGLLLTHSQTNKQCTHACPQLLTCSRPCSCPRTPSSHTITPRLNAPSAQSVCARGSCTSLAPPPPTASGWGRTALFVSSRCNSLPRKEPVPMYQTITSASPPSSSLYSLRNSLRLALHHEQWCTGYCHSYEVKQPLYSLVVTPQPSY